MNSCATCFFWKDLPNATNRGRCQARPPIVVAASDYPRTQWPITFSEDWCGEWRQKPTSTRIIDPVPSEKVGLGD